MNPFYFGTSERPLYGIYHPPRLATPRPTGVVLCYPMGQEYMRAHRAFRQLTTLFTKAGFHVLRFDYYATGDSSGEGEEASVAQWVADTRLAIQELQDTASVRKVSLVGLRLGAALAAQAVAGRSDVEDLVLWDPVVRGGEYVAELLGGGGPAGPEPEGTVGVLGFPLTAEFRRELGQLDITTVPPRGVRRAYVIVSREQEGWTGLSEAWKAAGAPAEYRLVPSPGKWNEVDNFGSALLPQDIIQGILSCLS